MSRMTKFLKQECQVTPYQVGDDGKALLNRFGEIVYGEPVTCKCRREKIVKDIVQSNGAVLQATTRYFLDEKYEPKADYLIDGAVVLTAEEYINERGTVEGYEVYT